MKLAFVDNLAVYGGLSRFSFILCKNLVTAYPSLEVDYYTHYSNIKNAPELEQLQNVTIKILESSKPLVFLEKIKGKIRNKIGIEKLSVDDKILKEIEERIGTQYDLAYFPCAHMMKKPSLSIPIVGTLHDFNWKYFFGRQTFPLSFVTMMDVEILKWMQSPYNICSSQDVVDEAKKLYATAAYFPNVVHIGPVVFSTEIPEQRSKEILNELGIDYPYIIFPGNFFPHKNHLNLFTAFYLLKKRKGFEKYKLLLTGMNSDNIPKGIAEYRGVQLLTVNSSVEEYDVRGMGYQPNEKLDTLIQNASLLVSPSIYEAICTPAMDAWSFGTPTAISDIPPFREHEKAWGIRSAFFDPMDPKNIADVLEKYLNDPKQTKEDGLISQKNMRAYEWKQVAKGYMDIFEKAITIK
jgi:glycosyltransferase involved in cell wall biosynthesis